MNSMLKMYKTWPFSSGACVALLLGSGPVYAAGFGPADPLRQLDSVPPTAANHMVDTAPGADGCAGNSRVDLTLLEIVSGALCHNPKTQEAWADVKVQAAQVGVSKAAYLPTLNGTLGETKDSSTSRGSSSDPFVVQSNSHYQSAALTLNWVLYDFGARSASVDYAQSKLASALAGQNTALQQVFASTVKDYYAALVAQKDQQATQEIEANAKQVLDAATLRVSHGVAAVSDQLQAQTAYLQASFNRNKAQGDCLAAVGQLAIDMGRRPNMPLHLHDSSDLATPDMTSTDSVDELLKTAQQRHPSLVAARADLDAARANVRMVSAQGRPTISFVGHYNYDNQPQSSGVGQQYLDDTVRDRSVAIQVNIPIFEGFTRTYQVRGAEAQVEGKEASLSDAELQVASSVWSDYQSLQVGTQNVRTSQQIYDSAQQAFDAAQARYAKGVTGIVEVITTQTALANAQQQKISAFADWQNARIQLASSLGSLDLGSLYPAL